MRSGLKSCIGFFLLLWTGIVLPGACTCKGGGDVISEMREFDSFSVLMSILWQRLRAG